MTHSLQQTSDVDSSDRALAGGWEPARVLVGTSPDDPERSLIAHDRMENAGRRRDGVRLLACHGGRGAAGDREPIGGTVRGIGDAAGRHARSVIHALRSVIQERRSDIDERSSAIDERSSSKRNARPSRARAAATRVPTRARRQTVDERGIRPPSPETERDG